MTGMDADAALRAARMSEWKHRLVWFGVASAVLAVAVLIRLTQGDTPAAAAAPQAAKAATSADDGKNLPRPGRPQHDVMALVNGKDVSRVDLTNACVQRFGEAVLESLVNKRLITSHCANRGITVTNEEIAGEIDQTAKNLQLSREQFLEVIQKERGVSPQEYARDIVWPMIALRKLAGPQLEVSKQEIDQAYEEQFGEMIRARLIVVGDEAKARDLQATLAAKPEDFARMAIDHSEDVNSASVGGIIQPIRRHVGDKGIEQAAFALQPGQVSGVIAVGPQYVILKCDERIQPREVPLATVQAKLVERIKDEKLRGAARDLFAQVQQTATIQNVYNNPELRQTMPGVVATVNGDKITMQELGAECLLRHGEEVLEGEISRILLEQELAAAKIVVEQKDIDAEIVHGAELAGCVDAQGNADVAKWLETVTTEQGMTKEQYIADSVWPSAALKKLTAAEVRVTDEDIAKGFEANYGERVRCRAIVLGNMRRAQEVWDKARRNPAAEYFGDLAAEYSVEPTSKALRGEVPPIGKHGGQEQLEKVAFQLQDNQISGIIQVGDKFVILRCEGRTERLDVDLKDPQIRNVLHRDIFEKKLRMAMGRKFEEINERARVDNYLAGSSHAPEPQGKQPVRQDTAVRPTVGSAK